MCSNRLWTWTEFELNWYSTKLNSKSFEFNSTLQIAAYRRELEIHVSGFDPPKPIQTFGQAGFDHLLLGVIKKAGYEKPTPIQAQALPAILSGRDVLVSVVYVSDYYIYTLRVYSQVGQGCNCDSFESQIRNFDEGAWSR